MQGVVRTEHVVVIAEDDPDIADILKSYLERGGFRVAVARDGDEALRLHAQLKPDLLLLDVSMPRTDGWGVLAEVRRRGDTPVIMVTARDEDTDKISALRIGADDYVTKPFNPSEVVARVGAVLRRAFPGAGQRVVVRVGEVEIDEDQHAIYVHAMGYRQAVVTTATEFRLLARMARSPRRVFSRSELRVACLPEGDALERTVDSHLSKLRKKLEDAGVQGMLASVRGVGYRLAPAR
ncbi:response regulator [Luteibacter sahnii]|uniref:response regulator n=1 Tax=Luteibacter sahnii TaxID=3021977 RepID=UPI002A6B45B5|nr:response regulator [Luteibacter sp. PPL193]MDY1548019.1 response regulator [Luteibacter sp. PPL193]